MSDQITYTAAIVDHLQDITQRKSEFDGLHQHMDSLRTKVLGSWGQGSAASFEAAHRKWSSDVGEIQETLAQIIRAASDGVGDMAATESAVAKSFHG